MARRSRTLLLYSTVLVVASFACDDGAQPRRVDASSTVPTNDGHSDPQRAADPGADPRAGLAAPAREDETWLEPPAEVVEILDAPPTPWVRVSPTGAHVLVQSSAGLPPIERVAEPFLRLAGVRVDAVRHQRHRTSDSVRLRLRAVDGAAEYAVELPPKPRISAAGFSPDGAQLAFVHETDDAAQLWVAEVASGKSRMLVSGVNGVLGRAYTWLPDSSGLVVRVVPPSLGPAPMPSLRPSGPDVRQTSGRKAQNRTYQDLLTSRYDELAFTHYATSEPTVVPLKGEARSLGSVGVFSSLSVSPDGTQMLVVRLVEPYSRAVPYRMFARAVEVWSLDGGAAPRLVTQQPAAEEVPIGGVRVGPRSFEWDPWEDATLTWTEALDGGDPKQEAEHRDKLMRSAGPEFSARVEYARTEHRAWGVSWLQTRGDFFVDEYDRDRRWRRTTWRRLAEPEFAVVVDDRSVHDRYADPGSPEYRLNERGRWVVRVDDGHIYRSGSGATPKGDRPFLDRVALDADAAPNAAAKTRLFESPEDAFASVSELRDDGSMIVRHESPTTPPEYRLRPAGTTGDGDRPLVVVPHPHPQLSAIEGELITYERDDGVPLSGTLYLPPGHQDGDRHPLVLWAYPVEYLDKDTAGQVRAAPTRFKRLAGTSPLFYLTQGYAVLDGAAMPVVGDADTMNDTLIPQLVGAAKAAIDTLDARGVIDRDRVAISGHSYGAFMTANLLAHSDLFRAGVARSGAYNRTLTPFGFQSERRTLWDAIDTYVAVSPLFAADKIDEPLLMIHGAVDSNSGTFPLQSERLFHAMSGLGGTAKLVMLPHESHGYRSREATLHVLAESFAWLDTHMQPRDEPG